MEKSLRPPIWSQYTQATWGWSDPTTSIITYVSFSMATANYCGFNPSEMPRPAKADEKQWYTAPLWLLCIQQHWAPTKAMSKQLKAYNKSTVKVFAAKTKQYSRTKALTAALQKEKENAQHGHSNAVNNQQLEEAWSHSQDKAQNTQWWCFKMQLTNPVFCRKNNISKPPVVRSSCIYFTNVSYPVSLLTSTDFRSAASSWALQRLTVLLHLLSLHTALSKAGCTWFWQTQPV